MKNNNRMLIVATLLLLSFSGVVAADDDNYEINWFLLLNYGFRTTGELPEGFGNDGDYHIAEERTRMDLTAWSDSIEAEINVKLDFYHDAIDDEFDIDVREAYLDYTTGPWDMRFGRQVITWGVGDLRFINDVWTKDWFSFFAGRPLEYLKSGVDGARIRYSGDVVNAELVVLPTFDPDIFPTGDRFAFYDPFRGIPNRTNVEPEQSLENTEVALRLYKYINGFDVSFYAYKGFWHEPAVMLDNPRRPSRVTEYYPELNVFGASTQGSALDGIVSLEFGYYDSAEDPDGDNPFIKNSQLRYLAGYSRQIATDTTLGLQYYHEEFLDWDNALAAAPGMDIGESYRNEVTVSLRRLAMQQRLTLYVFGYYSPIDKDFYVLPQISYKYSDELSVTLGGNFWGGDSETSFFGQFDPNDNVYVSVRYDF